MSTIHEVAVRDRGFNVLGILTRWTTASLRLRFNAPGSGTVDVHSDDPLIGALRDGGGILIVRVDSTSRTVLASGSVISERDSGDIVTFEIADDTAALADTLALPVPTGPPYTAAEYDTRTGVASTIMRQFVDANTGVVARVDRQRPHLTFGPDPEIGDTITGRARFQALDELLRELALVGGGLRFWCEQQLGTTYAIFYVSAPTDRSSEVQFTRDAGSLGPYEKTTAAGGPNYIFAGAGDALGADRTVYELGDNAAIAQYGRREAFLDTRGETAAGDVYQKLAEDLANAGQQTSLTVEPSEDVPFEYGRDYQLGDIVGTEFGPAIVREVTLTITPEGGLQAMPVIGTPGSSSDDIESRQIAAVARRLSNIERNFNIPDDSVTPEMLVGWARWNVGDYRETTRSSAAPRWLLCEGQPVSRTTYAALFAVIGTTYGAGDGSTTFNLPDRRGKYSRGAGALGVSLGESGGSASADVELPAHSHAHSHGGGSLVYTHTHPGGDHVHNHDHDLDPHVHDYSIDHDHGAVDSAYVNSDSVAVGHASLGSGATDHKHEVNLPPYDVAALTTDEGEKSGGGAFTSTKSRTGVNPTNPYSTGSTDLTADSWSGGTDPDSTAAGAVEATITVEPPFIGVNYEIYVGV